MTRLLTIPDLIQGNTVQDVVNSLNTNFQVLDGNFNGFTVTAQPPAAYTIFGTTVPVGGLLVGQVPVYTNAAKDTAVVVQPKITIFVDPPTSNSQVILPIDASYAFPNGSNVPASATGTIISTTVSAAPITPADLSFFTFFDGGVNYYPCTYINFCLRNAGSATHNFIVQVTASVYSSNNSQFR